MPNRGSAPAPCWMSNEVQRSGDPRSKLLSVEINWLISMMKLLSKPWHVEFWGEGEHFQSQQIILSFGCQYIRHWLQTRSHLQDGGFASNLRMELDGDISQVPSIINSLPNGHSGVHMVLDLFWTSKPCKSLQKAPKQNSPLILLQNFGPLTIF